MGDAARAFVSFLLCEANQAEGRARSLRATAAMIEANNIEVAQSKTRQKRKRTGETDMRSRTESSGYSMYFQESSKTTKKNETLASKKQEGSCVLTNQWGTFCEEDKQLWQSRDVDSSQHQHKNNYHSERRREKPK
mmetsp:Transcript_11822/g.28018  ORF Transcript_11822/g.28018 Transcript_11822/m.28018 type:complete len:136 (-) Transcript_11822:269-676(-)